MKFERKDLSFYPEDVLEYQLNRYERTANDFKSAFSYEAQAVFSAPGRSEICGNHTDHNLGKAVGASVNLDIIAFAAKRDDGKICIKANGFDDINVDISDLEMRDDEKNNSTALVRGVEAHRVAIDKHLAATSENWALARMPIVDRSILRLATYEMMYVDDVPTSVTINEAVELAKDFGGEDESPRFVNGVLGRIAKILDEEKAAPKSAPVNGAAEETPKEA